MGVRQVFWGDSGTLGSSTRWVQPTSVSPDINPQATEADGTVRWQVAGTFRGFRVALAVAPGVGASRTIELYVNGSGTGLVVTISGTETEAEDITNTVDVEPGDTLSLRSTVTGSPANAGMQWSLLFDGDAVGESGHAWVGSLSTSEARVPALGGGIVGDAWQTQTISIQVSVARVAGTLAALHYELLTAPGAGTSRTFALYVNGSSHSTVTIADAATTGSWTTGLTVAPDDTLQIRMTVSGSPANTIARVGVVFVADTDGESNLCAHSTGNLVTDRYAWAPLGPETRSATESARLLNGAVGSVTLSHLRVVANDSLTNADFVLRKSGSPTAVSVNLTTATAASNTGDSVSIAPTDTFSFYTSGTYGLNRTCAWGFRMTALAPTPPDPIFDDSLVCPCPCECDDGPSSGSTGPIQPPVNVVPIAGPVTPLDPQYWTAVCVGGGLVPTAADPTVHENWVRV